MRLTAIALGGLIGQIATSGVAQETLLIFGHEIAVVRDVLEHRLMINGQEAMSDGAIWLQEIGLAGGVPYVLGVNGTGGNMCGGAPFVISFERQTPAIDASPLPCLQLEHQVRDGEIIFTSYGTAANPSRAWVWTPRDGFQESAAVLQDAGSGWDAFRTRAISVPSDLLLYADLVEELRGLAGEDFDLVSQIIYGPPDGSYVGPVFIGSNCISHACSSGGTLIIADLTTRGLFLAWNPPQDGPSEVRPSADSWPDPYRELLEVWDAQW
jgi:hypothetical protein